MIRNIYSILHGLSIIILTFSNWVSAQDYPWPAVTGVTQVIEAAKGVQKAFSKPSTPAQITSSTRSNRNTSPAPTLAHRGTLVLTPSQPSGSGSGTLTAPGLNRQAFQIHPIDVTAFSSGSLSIEITVGSGLSSASFDLFPGKAAIPTVGRPTGTLAGSYDIPPKSTTSLRYRFDKGQVFQFGATGNWFTDVGKTNTYAFKATVSGEAEEIQQSYDSLRTIVRRRLQGGSQLAGVSSDANDESQRIALDWKKIHDASINKPQELANILIDFLKDQQLGKEVYYLVEGRPSNVEHGTGGRGNPIVLSNLKARLPADHYLLRYIAGKERIEQAELNELIQQWQMAAKFVVAIVEIGATAAGLPMPVTKLSNADLFFRSLNASRLSEDERAKMRESEFKAIGNLDFTINGTDWQMKTAWEFFKLWSMNHPASATTLDPIFQKSLNEGEGASQSEFVWFERVNAAHRMLSGEVWTHAIFLNRIDQHLKERGWTRQASGGIPEDLRAYVTAGNIVEGWLDKAHPQVLLLGYYSGYPENSHSSATR